MKPSNSESISERVCDLLKQIRAEPDAENFWKDFSQRCFGGALTRFAREMPGVQRPQPVRPSTGSLGGWDGRTQFNVARPS
jgi:hypothetical protein